LSQGLAETPGTGSNLWGVVVRGLFFLSGAAALLFETLWFRQAGLMLGNTVWAAAIVTASFMAGLALGSALAARAGSRVSSPLRAYAILELVVAATGMGLVLAYPGLTRALVPVLQTTLDQPALLNALRVVAAGALLAVPSTAMGATLPLLVRFLARSQGSYGWALGQLYGWNTVGAMAGALLGEAVLVEALGVRGTALVAAALNVLAAGAALLAARRLAAPSPAPPPEAQESPASLAGLSRRGRAVLAAAFLAGALLLALETVWFRLLQLLVAGTSAAFAVMLAVVLLGIGAGGFLASAWLRRARAEAYAVAVAFLGGVTVVVTYAGLPSGLPGSRSGALTGFAEVVLISVRLMLPTCLVSGLIFTLVGRALQSEEEEETRATGWLTLFNTVGAMCGALGAGFLLLPRLGMEASFFFLAAGYGLVGALLLSAQGGGKRAASIGAGALLLLSLVLFPFGLMHDRVLKRVSDRWGGKDIRVVAVREGLTETAVLFRRDLFGEPLFHRLVTNSSSMAGTTVAGRRYMGLFAWWPVALHPAPRRALLISYGCGLTARALTETKDLESIDVVDVSRSILDLSPLLHPPPAKDPLEDPRVRLHVEDGRFHLLVSPQKYDIITAEPPPLKDAGTLNLYSREHFRLLRERLAEGGLATYWLPVYQLSERETRSILGAFCEAFADCSLWTGWGAEWMLAGSREARGPASREAFSRQWRDPEAGPALRDAGFEVPEQLGATFLADATLLRALARGVPVLEDDRPYVLSPRIPAVTDAPLYVELMDTAGARERFARSEFVARLWPEELRESTLEWFAIQEALNKYTWGAVGLGASPTLRDLEPIVTGTSLRTAVLWLMGTSPEAQHIVERAERRGVFEPIMDVDRGMRAMAARDYRGAEEAFARAETRVNYAHHLRTWRILALAAGGDRSRAAALLADSGPWMERRGARDGSWEWLAQRFDVPLPKSGPRSP
jgi:predicted membrane-bound spermidine synthase